MKTSAVALVIGNEASSPDLVEVLSDVREIHYLEAALQKGEKEPLHTIHIMREEQAKQEEQFGDYVEELLCKPFVKPEIQKHGVQWLRSKIKIERYQKIEQEAAQIIADYAYKIFRADPTKTDFLLSSPKSQVRVRIFQLRE